MKGLKYPIGIQTFAKIREENYLYVDKTDLVANLVGNGGYYFLTRPRRFGKSLLMSTIEAFYRGKKDLFKGLAIENMDLDWTPRPVLHFDLSPQKYESNDSIARLLYEYLKHMEEEWGITEIAPDLTTRFMKIIRTAADKSSRKVVILIDEYDKPLLESMFDTSLQTAFRNELSAFYSVLKVMDPFIEFAMLTGVTKFGALSVFSGLNNLRDISLEARFASICGITERELYSHFSQSIRELASLHHVSDDTIAARLKENYDGYHFSAISPDIYNPFSLLNAFASENIGTYWFSTGTPYFLARLLLKNEFNLNDFSSVEASAETLGGIDKAFENPIGFFYQSGYLTIKKYDAEEELFTLGYPNREVEKSFLSYLLPRYAKIDSNESAFAISRMRKDLMSGDAESFMIRIQSLFAGLSYENITLDNLELHYHNVMYLVCTLLGFTTHTEYRTAVGRIDLLVEVPEYVYIMEFKINSTPVAALNQIIERGYATKFKSDNRHVIMIGANFSTSKRTLDNWLIK